MEATCVGRIEEAYEKHPLTASTILDRIRRQRGGALGVSEIDLAHDDETFITDQNHTGGLDAVLHLAQAIHLSNRQRVLDIGTGLGGTPRALAHFYACECHGVELTHSRYHDALELTDLVGLSDLVTFSHGDFLSLPILDGPYDVVIGQATFMHFSDPGQALQKCRDLLVSDGHLIIEDGYLCHPPWDSTQRRKTEAAWSHWNGRFCTLHDWHEFLSQAGFELEWHEDLTDIALDEYERQFRIARKFRPAIAPGEMEGWRLGNDLIRDGVIGMMRLICRRSK